MTFIKKPKMNLSNLSSMRLAFSQTLIELAGDNPNLYVVSADLKSSLTLDKFASKFRQRFIECGVAEANAAGVAAGLAKAGNTVFLASYACFSPAINWNTIKQSICYNNLNVKIIGSHGGLMTGELGATHQMLEDIALMRTLPNMEVFAPLDAVETVKIITTIARSKSPSYVRLVRPSSPVFSKENLPFTIGKSEIIKKGDDITIIGYGPILTLALNAQTKLDHSLKTKSPSFEIINCSSIKPLDHTTILASVKKTGRLIVVEDHQKNGGFGEAVASLILNTGLKCRFVHLAVDDQFGQSAKDYTVLWNHYGIGIENLITAVKNLL
jgi:transketolase